MRSNETIDHIETLIRGGRLVRARQLFRSLPLTKVRDEKRLQLANFARRLDQLPIGLRLLRPQIFERPPEDQRQYQAVLAEYAILLLQNGNIHEANDLLGRVRKVVHQDVYIARAWCHFEFWEYEKSIQWWEKYISAHNDPYWRIAGRINLAEAKIVIGAAQEGLAVLDSVINETEKAKNSRLIANALHLRARAYFCLGEIDKSDLEIRHALELFGDRVASDSVLIRRQFAINRAFVDGNENYLLTFRAEAERLGAWESVRECDFQRLKLNFRPELFAHLYQGTPFPAYRDFLEKSFQTAGATEYLWGDEAGPELNLRMRKFRNSAMTCQCAALIDALLRDFYRPPSVSEIFASIFQGESFDPMTSPARVHQAIMRLRDWLLEARVPLRVQSANRKYFLRRTRPLAVVLKREGQLSSSTINWRRLAKSDGMFSVRDVQRWLAISKATATRRLSDAESRGQLKRVGVGRKTKYRVNGVSGIGRP